MNFINELAKNVIKTISFLPFIVPCKIPGMKCEMSGLNQKRRFAKKFERVIYKKHHKNPETVLKGPQRKAVVVKVFAIKPKKPNSGQRKCVLVRLNNGRKIVAYMPGEKARVQENGIVLIRGGSVQDCPGVNHKVIRGKYDIN